MKINVHAGHNPDGMIGCGACGIKNESSMNREVVRFLVQMLSDLGHTVHDCTVNDGTSARDVLHKIVKKCNANEVDLDISIHHNAGANDTDGNGRSCGTEIYIYHNNSKALSYCYPVLNAMESLGFRNRGVKTNPNLYVLKNTKAPAMLIECCFVDDRDDINLWNPQEVAEAICYGLTGKHSNTDPVPQRDGGWYKVQVGAFKERIHADILVDTLRNLGYKDAFIQEY